jgi:hypothetical protein
MGGRFATWLKPSPRKKQKRESNKTNDLTNWRVGAAFAALASWQVGVNGLVSSIEVGITGGGLIQGEGQKQKQPQVLRLVPARRDSLRMTSDF